MCSTCKYDPFADEEATAEWETMSNVACGLEPYARAELDDVDKLKHVISKGQLRGKGIVAFEVSGGQAQFYRVMWARSEPACSPGVGARSTCCLTHRPLAQTHTG